MLTSNKGFEEWAHVFGNEVMAADLIDRLLHHCQIVRTLFQFNQKPSGLGAVFQVEAAQCEVALQFPRWGPSLRPIEESHRARGYNEPGLSGFRVHTILRE